MARNHKYIVAQCVTALITVHTESSLFPNVYRFFYPSGTSDSLSKTRCLPVHGHLDMVVTSCMVSQSSFIVLRQILCMLASGEMLVR